MEKNISRDFNVEAKSAPNKKYQYDYDHIVRRYVFRTFEPYFQVGPSLEVGCYEGDTALGLSEYFSDLTVVEASDHALEVAVKKLPSGTIFINGRIEEVFIDRLFLNIFAINFLEHVDEVPVVLGRIRSLLAPGGRFFVVVPNADAPSRQIAVSMGLIPYKNAITPAEWEHGHRRTYSFDTLQNDIRESGFRIVCCGGLLFKPLANFQMDMALELGIVDMKFIEGTYLLGMQYPNLCSSIFAICETVE
jgi:SAM-dependent methyltransferase